MQAHEKCTCAMKIKVERKNDSQPYIFMEGRLYKTIIRILTELILHEMKNNEQNWVNSGDSSRHRKICNGCMVFFIFFFL